MSKKELELKDAAYTMIRTSDQFIVLATRDDQASITGVVHVKKDERLLMAAALIKAAVNLLGLANPAQQLEALMTIHAQQQTATDSKTTNLH